MTDAARQIDKYYRKRESRWGYRFVTGDAKHFGYYPSKHADISERRALEHQQDLIGEALHLAPGDKVLDAGCGRGVTACYLAQKYGARITGIDLLDFELAIGRRRAMSAGVQDKVRFLVGSYADIDTGDQPFDALYTSETLSHAPDVDETLRQFFAVLKRGGRLALVEYTLAPDGDLAPAETKALDRVIAGSAMFGLKQFRHDRFPDRLIAAGFVDVRERDITGHIRPSFDRLYRLSRLAYWISTRLGFSDRLINTATPTLLKPLIDKGLIRYCIFTAVKPGY